jgi:RNA polymerase sigma factor (sigma-70 family)
LNNPTTELELIAQLKQGNEAAFKQVFETHQDRIYNTILYMIQSVEEAQDLTQEVFVEVFLNVENFKAQSKLSTWIYRIAVNKALNHQRFKKARKRFGMVLSIFNLAPADDVPDFVHPAILLENKELSESLYQAINQLPEKQKTAFVLRQLEDLSYTEIAEVMQTTTPSVESLLFRAKQSLQKKLDIKKLSEYRIKNTE